MKQIDGRLKDGMGPLTPRGKYEKANRESTLAYASAIGTCPFVHGCL